jgi:ankyrin repeat protein
VKKLFGDALNTVKSAFKKDDLLGQELLKAATIANLTGIKMLLAKEVDPNYQGQPDKKTALHIAVEKNNLELVQLLLASGAHGSVKDSSSLTPLMLATEKNHQSVIKALCVDPQRSGINEFNFTGENVLNIALRVKQFKVAMFLVDRGADPDTALRRAIISGDEEQIGWFCKHGANPNIVDENGNSQFSKAMQNGDIKKMSQWLVWGADINFTAGNGRMLRTSGWSPLMVSIDRGLRESISFLLAQPKVNINIVAIGNVSALTIAIGKGDLETVEKLKVMGAELPEMLADGTTPLMLAALSGNLRLVQLVLKWKPQIINGQDQKGWTALMCAVKANSLSIVETLLQNGADKHLSSREYKFTAQKIARNQKAVVPPTLPNIHEELDQIVALLGPEQ